MAYQIDVSKDKTRAFYYKYNKLIDVVEEIDIEYYKKTNSTKIAVDMAIFSQFINNRSILFSPAFSVIIDESHQLNEYPDWSFIFDYYHPVYLIFSD